MSDYLTGQYNFKTGKWEAKLTPQPSQSPASQVKPITLTLPNGLALTGSPEEVIASAKKLGHDPEATGELYFSSSKKQYISIKDMAIPYARNSFLKRLSTKCLELIEQARKVEDREFISLFTQPEHSIINNDKVLFNLLRHIIQGVK